MSFRHTYITEFLYKHGKDEQLQAIRKALDEYGTVTWTCSSNDAELGYFHGIIKDLDSHETKNQEEKILQKLEELGVKMKIVFE